MHIAGLQKLTLLDFPGKMACIVFTHGCNFRCPFCHNAPLVVDERDAEYDEEAFFAFLAKRKGILDGVVITGGEPLLEAGLAAFIERIRAAGYLVKLDTNGSFPDRLAALIEKNLLDYIAMDVKTELSEYERVCGVRVDVERIKESIRLIRKGGVPHEFRTTVVKGLHTKENIVAVAGELAGEPYYLQGFVDSGHLIGEGCEAFTGEEMHDIHDAAKAVSDTCFLRGIE